MRFASQAVAVIMLATATIPAFPATAGKRPGHDPAIEAAAIAILQRKLPKMRPSFGLAGATVARRYPTGNSGATLLFNAGGRTSPPARINWL